MTRVLLITDTERVQRIFQALEDKGVLQLRIAGTLTQGDQEILSAAPEVTFIQSRISGFSGDIMLGHLKKTLPEDASIVLLAGDAGDAAHARKHARPFLDLSAGDDLLAETILKLINGSGRSLPAKAAAGKSAGKKPAAGLAAQETEEPVAAKPSAGLSEQEAAETAETAEEGERARKEHSADAPVKAGKARAASFQEIMQRASATTGPFQLGPDDVEDRVDIGRPPAALSAPPDRPSLPAPDEVGDPVPMEEFFRGETLADAMLRAEKKKRPYWVLLVALLLVLVPLAAYLSGKRAAPPSPLPAPGSSNPLPRKAAGPGAGTGAAPSDGASAKLAAPPPEGKPEVRTATPAAMPVAKPAPAGLKTLPLLLEGTRLDAAYGKTHPGWVRYIGKRAEYNLFREAGLYKAMQVIAAGGGTLSDQLFQRVLADFGGGDSYQTESTGKKGDYLLEQGVAKNGVALFIYRKKDRRIKAVVLYYR